MERKFKYGYPNCIEEFLFFYEATTLDDNDSINHLDYHLEKLQDFFISEYKRLFNTTEFPSYDYIQENIFPNYLSRVNEKQQVKINLCSIIHTFSAIIDDLELKKKEHYDDYNSYKNFKENTRSIFYFVDDYIQFYSEYLKYFHNKPKGLLLMRRMESFNIFDSIEISAQLLHGKIDYEYFSMHKIIPGAIPFIRQTIELVFKDSLNIHKISNSNGEPLKVSGYLFLDFFIENQERISFPVKFSLLKKVYEWSNYFIHGGIVNYYWTIWEAQQILYKFFPFKEKFDESHFILFDKDLVFNIKEVLTLFLAKKLNVAVGSINIEFHNKYGGLNIKKII